MSALIIALFCVAGLLALAAMASSARNYAAAWSALARQFERGGELPRKHLVYARRHKQPPSRRAKARARRASRAEGHDARIATNMATATRKLVQNPYSRFGVALRSDRLVTE
jgi:hypothetical protein